MRAVKGTDTDLARVRQRKIDSCPYICSMAMARMVYSISLRPSIKTRLDL